MPRMTLHEAVRDHLVQVLPKQGCPAYVVKDSLTKWNDGRDPVGPMEHACFEVFKKVQADIENQEEPNERSP